MSGPLLLSNFKKVKKFLYFFLLSLFIGSMLLFTFKLVYKEEKHSKKFPSLDSFITSLPIAQFAPTSMEKFGEDGVHCFNNLYYHAHEFLFGMGKNSNPYESPLNFFGKGEYAYAVSSLNEDAFSKLTKSKQPYKIQGTTLILASSREMKSLQPHYFHFLEEFVLAWSAYRHADSKPVSTVIFPDIDHWEGVNKINHQILQALIPNVTVLNKTQFNEFTKKNLVQFENAIIVDRLGCHNLQPVAIFNKMLLGHAPLIKNEYLKEIRDSVLSYLKTSDQTKRPPTITYINRKNRRYLDPEFEKKFLQVLRTEFPDHKVQAVWFEKLNYAQQLQVIRNTDILIGAHGNGLTHSYFLPDNALVLEIFPNGAFAMDYQLISELAEHSYYAIEPKEGIISFAGHHMPPRGNVNQVIQEFDMSWVLSPIKDHIQELEKTGLINESSS